MGRALTFRASSRGHRGIRAYRDGQFFTQLLGGPMEAGDPHVPLSLGRDGSYSTGCVILIGTAVGWSSHRTYGATAQLGRGLE